MQLIQIVLFFFSGFMVGWHYNKTNSDKEGVSLKNKMKALDIMMEDTNEMRVQANEMRIQAEEMKMAFMEKIHQKIEVKILVKDDKNVSIDTLKVF